MPDENILARAEFNPKVKLYWLLSGTITLILTIVGIPLLLLWIPLGLFFTGRYLNSMECTLTDRSLRVKKGLLNRIEKTVPLDKITDLAIRQGPIMRALDLEGLSIETAGQSGTGALVGLVGVRDAKAFRDTVLAQRDRVTAGESTGPKVATQEGTGSVEVLREIRDSMQRIEELLKNRQ